MEIFTLDFMIRALCAAFLTGLAAPAIGTYLVQRRMALMGDGIGHVAVTGVALGLLTGASPTLTAVLIAITGAIVIEVIRATGRASGDVALALLFYGGIAGGLVIASRAGNGTAALNRYLFGSVTTTSNADLVVSAVLAVVVIAASWLLFPQLFAVAYDELHARTTGIPVRFYSVLIAVLAAITVSVAMRTVGLLLVSALMIIPVATAQQFTRGFRVTLVTSQILGVVAALGGVVLSAFIDAPPGALIVLLALAGFAITAPIGLALARRRQALLPFPETPHEPDHDTVEEPHRHQHGPGCGHPAVEHGDHVDYLHDGHRHALHGSHYDEH
ncbi:MAG: metal ABC transporter permease [Myxococcales bacterium]|nr:MAG: metal ABC transporter permease [Myxococcales bacterium]